VSITIGKKPNRIDKDELVRLLSSRKPESGKKYTHQEIADVFGVTRGAVTAMIKTIPEELIARRTTENYRQARADLFADLQRLILSYITPKKLNNSSLQQLGNLFKIFYEKEKLEQGLVTDKVEVIKRNALDKQTIKQIEEAIGQATAKRLQEARKASKSLAQGEYLTAVK
jgi:predicted DNA-binding protein YlxM (UPF0122 family)